MLQWSRTVRRHVAMFLDRSDSASIIAVKVGVSADQMDGLRRERIKPILDMIVSRFNALTRFLPRTSGRAGGTGRAGAQHGRPLATAVI
jgi:response regulator NasT